MDQAKILIVDDEPNVRFILERTLSGAGYLLDKAENGAEAIEKIKANVYDLILLDLQMKPIDGMQVLTAVRRRDPDTAVIILTAHSTIESAVEALRMGAFDYLFKPASPETIRERVQEGLKQRQQTQQRERVLKQIEGLRQTLVGLESEAETLDTTRDPGRFHTSGKLVIDMHHRSATLAGRLLDLTTTEFNLLACLVQLAPDPVSARQLVNEALEYDTEDAEASEIVKWHIHHLRQKVEPDPEHPRFIKTVRYKGYMWSGE
ncbi:MAG: response regulator transcription factor [Chloroflexota bacterium]